MDAGGSCVLADVGMVYITDMPEFAMMKSATTVRWTAPELMDPNVPRQKAEGPECTTQSDVYSFAMTVIEVRFRIPDSMYQTPGLTAAPSSSQKTSRSNIGKTTLPLSLPSWKGKGQSYPDTFKRTPFCPSLFRTAGLRSHISARLCQMCAIV